MPDTYFILSKVFDKAINYLDIFRVTEHSAYLAGNAVFVTKSENIYDWKTKVQMITFDVVWCHASWRWCLCCPLIPALFISLRSPKVSTVTRLQVVQPQHYAKFVCVSFEHQELENLRLVLGVHWSNILNSSQWDREIFGDRKKLLSNCRVSEESPKI